MKFTEAVRMLVDGEAKYIVCSFGFLYDINDLKPKMLGKYACSTKDIVPMSQIKGSWTTI